ncbi:hypothetical protein PAAG_12424 [Paracoccidioides lutzii Pb01]|uniref:Uncharacterized protein n=1 Tax=Paracoccidioides lutzii (strain ATCC MYA-826 / Pb01) TaxID=502779 RepID=A0A0A2UZ74_PARBA|nr:hypothetical protein PAAG_12424 [Paracoccidioides lutzii Pb01]KGQ00881.1 hypothetical protein PAAG_12424 [Paracoccidioides lutzii Pb01]
MPAPPAFSDIAKAANDLLNKDFYHTSAANLEVKSKAPNGVTFHVKGKSAHEGPISGSLESKYVDMPTGKASPDTPRRPSPTRLQEEIERLSPNSSPDLMQINFTLIRFHPSNLLNFVISSGFASHK